VKNILATSAALSALLVVSAAPAVALPAQAPSTAGSQAKPETPAANASPKSKARAYGRYCKDQSKKHVAGQKGTPFSQCVTAMAKLATGATESPRKACTGLSKKHVSAERGTAFSRCVVAGAKLLQDQEATTGEQPATEEHPTAES
jgi:hypothetical protein